MCQNGLPESALQRIGNTAEQIVLGLLDARRQANFIARPGRNKKTENESVPVDGCYCCSGEASLSKKARVFADKSCQ
jgi:hypothetical protein